MIGAQDENLRPPGGPGFVDAVTFAFGDLETRAFGLARVGISPGEAASASALAVLFSGSEVAAAVAEGGIELEGPDWRTATAAGVSVAIDEPLVRWRARFAGDGGGFDLRFEALSAPVETQAGGISGYEQLCRVEGAVTAGGREQTVSCLGQRGHGWGTAEWDDMALARTLCGWWEGGRALLLTAVRPAKAKHHDEEQISAQLLEGDGDDSVAVADPRLSTTYDSHGRQRRAGLELFVAGEDDEYPRRAAGQVACGTTLELGRLTLDCAFFEWRMDGQAGAGRYDVLRRA